MKPHVTFYPRIFVAALFCSLLISCGKYRDINGTVYTKHGYTVPNAKVELHYSQGGKSQTVGFYTISTDENGYFSYHKKTRKNINFELLRVVSDSGNVEHPSRPGTGMRVVLN